MNTGRAEASTRVLGDTHARPARSDDRWKNAGDATAARRRRRQALVVVAAAAAVVVSPRRGRDRARYAATNDRRGRGLLKRARRC